MHSEPRNDQHAHAPTALTGAGAFYVTTPIYYVNDRPHIGSCYTTLVADVVARYQRLFGRDVLMLTGTDEHADRVFGKAVEHGVTPRQWADRCSAEFVRAFADLNIHPDVFYRTSDEHHKALAAQHIRELQRRGDVYVGDYVGWYDVSQDEYLTETVAKASGYVSPVSGKALEQRTEKNYFFRLSAYESRLRAHIEANPDFVQPGARRNEVLGRLREGLQDVPVSRAIRSGEPDWGDWGVRMPDDPGHRVYVWIEALFNYLTAVEMPGRERYWPASVHLMAKDILWFHAVIWPAMLMALDRPLPRAVYAHAYFVREGRKMSKSLGNFVDIDTVRAYVARFGRDAFRWYLATQGPMHSTDADFSYAKFVEVYNAELANGLGNSTSRVGNMIAKYFDGRVPDGAGVSELESLRGQGFDWEAIINNAVRSAIAKGDALEIGGALREGVELVKRVDAYINVTEPFKMAKRLEGEGGGAVRAELGTILYQCAEALRVASVLMSPAIPDASARLASSWGFEVPVCHATRTLYHITRWGGEHSLRPGQALSKGEALFMRADPAEPEPSGTGGA
jgi:methionyl-tRNA synthetase